MNYEEYIHLASEISELEALLSRIPAEDVIDRLGFENRLKSAREKIAGFNPDHLPRKARLTFRGTPVLGSHGISADFASKAAGFFSDAFSAITAEALNYMGPIPDKQKNQLLITGTALGSFGFEFELPAPKEPDDPAQMEFIVAANKAAETIEKMEKLFQCAATGTDDDITGLVDEIHPRAVKKVAEFLEYVSNQNAWCGLAFGDGGFRFSGVEQVRTSAERLKLDGIKDQTETFYGELQGVLPKSRTFEFRLLDQDGVLKGKVGTDVVDPDVLNRNYLHKVANIKLRVIQVGQGRPRYTLENIANISIRES